MSLARLGGGADPIWADTRTYPTTTIPSFRSPILPVYDHSSWTCTISFDKATPSGGAILLTWYADAAAQLVVGVDKQNDLTAAGLDDVIQVLFQGPCRGPFVRLTITPPSFTDGGDGTLQADLVGTHLPLLQATWANSFLGSTMPSLGGEGRTAIADSRGGAAALVAKVLNVAPAATDPALLVRPIASGAYPGRVRIHFGTDKTNTLTTNGVANTEAAATLRRQRGTAAAATASSYTVTAGMRLRLVAGELVVAHSAAGGVWFAIRLTTALTGTQAWYVCSRAQVAGHLVVPFTIPDGFEFDAGEILQFSTIANVASQPVDLQLWGFEYNV